MDKVGKRRHADGAHPLRGEESGRRPGPLPRARAGGDPRAGPPAGGRRARPRQDADGEDAGADHPRHFPPHPVHARPGARRPRRHAHLQPEDRRVRHLARAGVLQPAARRRDQPRAGQGAERAARGDAGAPGDDRRRDPPRARAVPGDGDAEPDRDRGHLPAARSAGRPLHDEGAGRLSERRRGIRDRRARDRPAARRARRSPPPRSWRAAARMPPRLRRASLMQYAVRLVAATRDPDKFGIKDLAQIPDLRREPARPDPPDRGRARARVPARARLRAARGRDRPRARRVPPPPGALLRGARRRPVAPTSSSSASMQHVRPPAKPLETHVRVARGRRAKS